MTEFEDEEKIVNAWHIAFKQGTDFDLWGQPVEAIDGYQRLSKQLQRVCAAESSKFTDEQKKILGKIAICLDLRCKALQIPGTSEGVSLEDLQRIEISLGSLLKQKSRDFPVDVLAAQMNAQTVKEHQFPDLDGDDDRQGLRGRQTLRHVVELWPFLPDVSFCSKPPLPNLSDMKGSLLPQPVAYSGKSILSIRVEKIGLKNASQLIDPYITISVKDNLGADLMTHQDTPVASYKEDNYLMFNVDVHIQKTMDSLPPGYAIFFEVKHYKPKKESVSTRCWAFMESDEIKDGPAILELYRKPANFKRKNLHLLTVKPLYLHLKLSLNS